MTRADTWELTYRVTYAMYIEQVLRVIKISLIRIGVRLKIDRESEIALSVMI